MPSLFVAVGSRLLFVIVRVVKITVFFLAAVFMTILDVLWRLLTSILLSPISLIFLSITGIMFGTGLLIMYNPEFVMQTSDQVYECGLYPIADGTVTYVLRPLRDYWYMPNIRYINGIAEEIKDRFGDRVDAITNISDRPGLDTRDVTDSMNEVWDFLLYDVINAPFKASPPLYGPDKLMIPFERTLIRAAVTIVADNIGVNRGVWSVLKNFTLTLINQDTITASCFYQTLQSAGNDSWAFRGCKFTKSNCSDHVNGCAGCHRLTDDLAYYILPFGLHNHAWLITNITNELRELMLSLEATNVCPALLPPVTCSVVNGTSTLSNYDCSKIPWWVDFDTFPQLHCLSKTPVNGIMAPQLGTGCALYTLCQTPPSPTTCAHVDNSMALQGFTCGQVSAASNGLLGASSCNTESGFDCTQKDWSYWVDKVTVELLKFSHEFADIIDGTLSCMFNWVKTFLGMLVLIFDTDCQAGAAEIVQYIWRYNIWGWTECLKYPLEFIFRSPFKPIAEAFGQLVSLFGEMVTSLIDGSILTKSQFYCTMLKSPDRGCEVFTNSIEINGLDYYTNSSYPPGNRSGVVFMDARCSAAGYERRCTLSNPCPPLVSVTSNGCDWFIGKTCWDVSYNDTPSVFVPLLPTMTEYEITCMMRGGGTNTTSCRLFHGCRLFSGGSKCTGSLHNFTDRGFRIIGSMFANITTGFMTIEIVGWSPGATQEQVDKANAFFFGITDGMACVFNAIKGVFGSIILLTDQHCDGGFIEASTSLSTMS
jgi:hypothetical protein